MECINGHLLVFAVLEPRWLSLLSSEIRLKLSKLQWMSNVKGADELCSLYKNDQVCILFFTTSPSISTFNTFLDQSLILSSFPSLLPLPSRHYETNRRDSLSLCAAGSAVTAQYFDRSYTRDIAELDARGTYDDYLEARDADDDDDFELDARDLSGPSVSTLWSQPQRRDIEDVFELFARGRNSSRPRHRRDIEDDFRLFARGRNISRPHHRREVEDDFKLFARGRNVSKPRHRRDVEDNLRLFARARTSHGRLPYLHSAAHYARDTDDYLEARDLEYDHNFELLPSTPRPSYLHSAAHYARDNHNNYLEARDLGYEDFELLAREQDGSPSLMSRSQPRYKRNAYDDYLEARDLYDDDFGF